MGVGRLLVFLLGAMLLSVPAASAQPAEDLGPRIERMEQALKDLRRSLGPSAYRFGSGSRTVVLTTNQIAAIAVGAAGGALVVDLLGGGGLATAAGAVVGGILGHYLISAPPSELNFDP